MFHCPTSGMTVPWFYRILTVYLYIVFYIFLHPLYPIPCLTSWDWTSPHEVCAIFVYSLLVSPQLLPSPDSGYYHNRLPWMIKHEVCLSAFVCLSEYQNRIVGFPIWKCPSIFVNARMWEHCTFDCEIFRCGKVYYSNSIIISNFV
jgi:hypothetical protein